MTEDDAPDPIPDQQGIPSPDDTLPTPESVPEEMRH